MNGSVGNTINLSSDTTSTTAAKLNLNGDVTTAGTGLNTIASTGAGAVKGIVDLGAGTRTFTVADTVAGSGTDLSVSAVITNGGLTKSGAGTMSLDSANTYSGDTTVTAGTLALGANGSIANSPLVDLQAGAFDTTAQGFVMLSGQTFKFTLDPTGSGSSGLLNAGSLNISAGVVDFATTGTLDDPFYIIANYTTLSGSNFATVNNTPTGYQIDYNYLNGNQIALVVPEPGTFVMLLGGFGMLLAFQRSRRRS